MVPHRSSLAVSSHVGGPEVWVDPVWDSCRNRLEVPVDLRDSDLQRRRGSVGETSTPVSKVALPSHSEDKQRVLGRLETSITIGGVWSDHPLAP